MRGSWWIRQILGDAPSYYDWLIFFANNLFPGFLPSRNCQEFTDILKWAWKIIWVKSKTFKLKSIKSSQIAQKVLHASLQQSKLSKLSNETEICIFISLFLFFM